MSPTTDNMRPTDTVAFNPLTRNIQLVILPTDYHTHSCK